MKTLSLQGRPDVRNIIEMPDKVFQAWYNLKREATLRLLNDYTQFASIPHLGYDNAQYTMSAITLVGGQLEALQKGLSFLETLKKNRDLWLAKQNDGA
jgi:hypothetical protein